MICFDGGISIIGDTDGNLLKAVEKASTTLNSKQDSVKRILAAQVSSKEFSDYLVENNEPSKPSDVDKRKLPKLIREFYLSKSKRFDDGVENSIVENNMGFSTNSAMRTAKSYTSDLISSVYASSEKNVNAKKLYSDVTKVIEKEYDYYVKHSMNIAKNENPEEYAKWRSDVSDAMKEANDILTEIIDIRDNYKGDDKASKINYLASKRSGLIAKIDTIKDEAIDKYGVDKSKNYKALVYNVRFNAKNWYAVSIEGSANKLNHIDRRLKNVEEISNVKDFDVYDDSDIINSSSDGMNEETARWSDTVGEKKSYSQNISDSIKVYFDSLYNLREYSEDTTSLPYDTDNELGVRTTMKSGYVIAKIYAYVDRTSVTNMISSIESLSRNVKELYGLGAFVSKMKSDPIFANKIFSEFSGARTNKIIIDANESSISPRVSNSNSSAVNSLTIDYLNDIKSILLDVYDPSDADKISILNGVSFEQYSTDVPSRLLNIKILQTYMSKYFPKIKLEDYDILNTSSEESYNDFKELVSSLNTFISSAATTISKRNDNITNRRDYSVSVFDELYPKILNISNVFVKKGKARVELNSPNAEGNLGSDIISDNYISRTLDKIAFGDKESSTKGLELLKDFISLAPQYDESVIFYGVKDSKGKVLAKGMFTKDESGNITINKDAKTILVSSLFNGVSNEQSKDNTLYSKMSGADYFISSLVMFNDSVNHTSNYGDDRAKGDYFIKTPSDSGRTYSIQSLKFKLDGLIKSDPTSLSNFIGGFLRSYTDSPVVDAKQAARLYKTNIFDLNTISDIINGNMGSIDVSKTTALKSDKGVIIPILYRLDKGDYYIFNLLQSDNGDLSFINSSSNKYHSAAKFSEFVKGNETILLKDAIFTGKIKTQINKEHPIFRAFYQNVKGELINFIHNLNNVIETKDGQYKIKDTQNLYANYHYSKTVVKDGKFTGGAFNFKRIFDVGNYKANDSLLSQLPLYGQAIKISNDGVSVQVYTGPDSIIQKDGETFVPNITNETDEIITANVYDFINNFKNDIVKRSSKYNGVVGTSFSQYHIQEWAFNQAIMLSNFDDLFEGDSKFYKSAEDLLKRVKEIIAGGKALSAYSMDDSYGGELKELSTHNVNGREVVLKNGYKAVTINSTVMSSTRQEVIKSEMMRIVDPSLSEKTREQIAQRITNGMSAPITTNDAQSYITWDEFIRRRIADGTLDQYREIISYVESDGFNSDIDINSINARIQVQKNFGYDRQFDEITKTVYPRQIKNAEFVIIPKFVRGTSLEVLNDIMNEFGIDQINTEETSKAAKRNILTFWDNDGNYDADSFRTQLSSNSNIDTFYYVNLYKQQDVADHIKDEMNKVGSQIIVKIFDNLHNSSDYVKAQAERLVKAYSAKIETSYQDFLNRMDWYEDVEGNIVDRGNGTTSLNFSEFYRVLREDAQRLGADSNYIQALTPDETGISPIPNYMNNIATKIENSIQALFNTSIGRQKLPGWHAAQVTDVGFNLKEYAYSDNLTYHPEVIDENGNVKVKAVAEVLLPRWSSLLPSRQELAESILKENPNLTSREVDYAILAKEQEIIKQMNEEGLMEHIGYRIPTEGKQSVCVLKVVGFLDDAQGSTIVVPKEWVAQTGSDFDVDSVYGMSYHMYRKGNSLYKIPLDVSVGDSDYRRRYIKYVESKLKERLTTDYDTDDIREEIESINDSIKRLKDDKSLSSQFPELLSAYKETYSKIPADVRKRINSNITDPKNFKLKISQLIDGVVDEIMKEENSSIESQLTEVYDALSVLNKVASFSGSSYRDDIIELKSSKSKLYDEMYEKHQIARVTDLDKAAKKLNLYSFNEFKTLDIVSQNSKEAVDNEVVDSIKEIMLDDSSREETLSRSNFDDLSDAKSRVDKLADGQKMRDGFISESNRSAYNPFDQLDFQENANAARDLKGISVAKDKFGSLSNRGNARVGKRFETRVVYPKSKYNEELILAAYGENSNIELTEDSIIVTHSRFANSKNGRNVTGSLLLPYSSQTTAHAFDIIKNGAIANENPYTFGAFKNLLLMGLDYDAAILWMRSSGMNRVVYEYNNANSIYNGSNRNPINEAIRGIAKDLDIRINDELITPFTPIGKIKDALLNNQDLKNAYNKAFSAELPTNWEDVVDMAIFDISRLENRYKSTEIYKNLKSDSDVTKYDLAIEDLNSIMIFDRFNELSNAADAIAKCASFDNNGIPKTIKATKDLLNNIELYSDKKAHRYAEAFLVNGDPILARLYPNFSDGKVDVESSFNKVYATILNDMVIPSVNINSQLLLLESPKISNIVDSVEEILGTRLNEEKHNEFKRYIVSDMYNSSGIFQLPITVNDQGYIVDDVDRAEEYSKNETPWDSEIDRIRGQKVDRDINLTVKNLNKPTAEEIYEFNQLTPVQKIIWIQQNFSGGDNIFDKLKTSTYSVTNKDGSKSNIQSIRYNDQVDDIEDAMILFTQSFFNSNKFIKLATVDLIKYSFVVDGHKFKKGSISKIIPNDVLLANAESKGLDIIGRVNKTFNTYSNMGVEDSLQFIERFIRSHSDYVKLYRIPDVKKDNSYDFNRFFVKESYGLRFIPYTSDSNPIFEALGMIDAQGEVVEGEYNNYIRIANKINGKRVTSLYKRVFGDSGVYFYPMNLLDQSETDVISSIDGNNKYPIGEYYESLIRTIERENIDIEKTILSEIIGADELSKLRSENTIGKKQVKNDGGSSVSNNLLKDLVLSPSTGVANDGIIADKIVADISRKLLDNTSAGKTKFLIASSSPLLAKSVPNNSILEQNIPMLDSSGEYVGFDKTVAIKKFNVRDRKGNLNVKYINDHISSTTDISDNYAQYNYYQVEEMLDDDVKASVIPSAGLNNDYGIVNRTLSEISNELVAYVDRYGKRNKNDNKLNRFKDSIAEKGLTIEDAKERPTKVFEDVVDFYVEKANIIYRDLNNFEIDGIPYDISDEKLYVELLSKPDDYKRLINLLLEASALGKSINKDLYNSSVNDNKYNELVDKIKTVTDTINNSPKINKAFEHVFNVYFAKLESNNPLIKQGIRKVRDSFGDSNALYGFFASIYENPNAQINIIAKHIQDKINTAVRVDAKKSVRQFNEEANRIIKSDEDFSFDNIIKDGRFKVNHTEEFTIEKNRLKEGVDSAIDEYGFGSVEHMKAKLARDKFYAKNVEQIVDKSYYDSINEIVEEMLNSHPEILSEFETLKYKYSLMNDVDEDSSETDVQEKARLGRELTMLTNLFDDDLNYVSTERRDEIRALNEYNNKRTQLNREYFVQKPIDGIDKGIDYHKRMVEKYKDDPSNSNYQYSKDWLDANTRYTLDQESDKIIKDAYAILSKDSETINDNYIKSFLDRSSARLDDGTYDYSRLSEEELSKLKELNEESNSLNEDEYGVVHSLIKLPVEGDVFKKEFYDLLMSARQEDDSYVDSLITKRYYIEQINDILSKGIDPITGKLSSKVLFDNVDSDTLKELASLYDKASPKRIPPKSNDGIKFSDVAKTVYNNDEFNQQKSWASTSLSKEDYSIWKSIFMKKGDPRFDIFGSIVPKDKDKYLDSDKTRARKIITSSVSYETTQEYEDAKQKAIDDGSYSEWYEANHFYNEKLRKTVPLNIWTKRVVKPSDYVKGEYDYIPNYNNTDRIAREEKVNSKYSPNYLTYNSETGDYNNDTSFSPSEVEMMNLMKETMLSVSNTKAMKDFVRFGYLPRRLKKGVSIEGVGLELMSIIGLYAKKKDVNDWMETVDYSTSEEKGFDMFSIIKTKTSKEYVKLPKRIAYKTDEEFNEATKLVKEENKTIKAHNDDIDKSVLDNDWISVFNQMITSAAEYNAVNENKDTLYLLLEDLRRSNAGNNNIKLVNTWARRKLHKQYVKDNEGSRFTAGLQNLTSSMFMTLNVKAAGANLGIGLANSISESVAGEHYSSSDYGKGLVQYSAQLAQIGTGNVHNKTTELIKYFDIINNDDLIERGVTVSNDSIGSALRTAQYAPQLLGEHVIHNVSLLAQLKSNRVYKINGKTKIGTLTNYYRELEDDVMRVAINEYGNENIARRWDGVKAFIDLNENKRKVIVDGLGNYDYSLEEYFLNLINDPEFKKSYIKTKRTIMRNAKSNFNNNPTVESIFSVKDGKLSYDESLVSSDMIAALGHKIKQVNDKTQGVYDKDSKGRITQHTLGRLLMQFKNHIVPIFTSRFGFFRGVKGRFNEARESIEKPSYRSAGKLFSGAITPSITEDLGTADKRQNAITRLVGYSTALSKNLINVRDNWYTMPKWEQANVRRVLGDVIISASLYLARILFYGITDDDEIKENKGLSFANYTLDKIYSDYIGINPFTIINSSLSTMRNMSATVSYATDLYDTIAYTTSALFDPNYEPYYRTGRLAGENKLRYKWSSHIPGYRQYRAFNDIAYSSEYHKTGVYTEDPMNPKIISDIVFGED